MAKYIKFGLRADKNLSDLEDKRLALSNLLNDVSSQIIDGSPSGFSTSDLSAVFGLRNTGLADYVTTDGTSTDLLSLNGSLVEYTLEDNPNINLEVQPRITIQDNINNARTILGNPPWRNGGTGPIALFIPSSRINPSPTALTSGNSEDVELVSSLTTNNTLYTTRKDLAIFRDQIIEGEDFWNSGIFELSSKVHPNFPNTYGMIQWTGYLSARFTQGWESSGLFMIEQDLIDDGTDDNWTKLKSVYDSSITIDNVSWTTDGSLTTLQLGATLEERLAQVKFVCAVMKVTIDSTEYEIYQVNESTGTCTIIGDITNGSASSMTFTWDLSDDLISTGIIGFTVPRTGDKIRVRYTVWWPNPETVGLPAGSTYKVKRFAFNLRNTERLPFTYLYPTWDRDEVAGQFSYRFFEENRASVLKQESDYPIRINNTVSLMYQPPSKLHQVVVGMATNATTITPRTFEIVDEYGRLEGSFSNCSVGDWLTFDGTYVFQIEEIRSSAVIYVRKDILTITGFSVGQIITTGIVFKNLGLVGLYKLSSTGGLTGTLATLTGASIPLSNVGQDYICMGIDSDGNPGFQPLRITNVSGGTITTSTYAGGFGTTLPTTATPTTHVCAVYATRGLEDLSSTLQCVGVYGREVKTISVSGSSSIVLTTNSGVSVGDYLQYGTVVTEGTTVTSVNVDGFTIGLSAPITATLEEAATLVLIKSANYTLGTTPNKEFCVTPLNTAPPFLGTDSGLITTVDYKNLTTVDLAFGRLELTIPDSKIVTATPPTSVGHYFPIKYGNITYKALVV